jgi:type IV pilus assembly protein PilA
MRRARSSAGFTVIELMIVVAIIGIISLLAIPNFMRYQARARRTEAYANVAGIVRAQKSYQAERDGFFEALPQMPDWTLYGGLGTAKMPWDAASETLFAELGWKPEGQVYYGYGINTGTGYACPEACGPDAASSNCFTASAQGDVDGDGLGSEVMYVEPARDVDGNVLGECNSARNSPPPLDRTTNAPLYNEVAVRWTTDEY